MKNFPNGVAYDHMYSAMVQLGVCLWLHTPVFLYYQQDKIDSWDTICNACIINNGSGGERGWFTSRSILGVCFSYRTPKYIENAYNDDIAIINISGNCTVWSSEAPRKTSSVCFGLRTPYFSREYQTSFPAWFWKSFPDGLTYASVYSANGQLGVCFLGATPGHALLYFGRYPQEGSTIRNIGYGSDTGTITYGHTYGVFGGFVLLQIIIIMNIRIDEHQQFMLMVQ